MNVWLREFRQKHGPGATLGRPDPVDDDVDVVASSEALDDPNHHHGDERKRYEDKRKDRSRTHPDPALWDTRLNARGIAQARELGWRTLLPWSPQPEVLLSSPLQRALSTAAEAFLLPQTEDDGSTRQEHPLSSLPREVIVESRERLWHSSDVGTRGADLRAAWGIGGDRGPGAGWAGDLDTLPDADPWWDWAKDLLEEAETEDGPPLAAPSALAAARAAVARPSRSSRAPCEAEPPAALARRAWRLRERLAARPETCLVLVCHWGIIEALTGEDFRNCECRCFRMGELSGGRGESPASSGGNHPGSAPFSLEALKASVRDRERRKRVAGRED